MLSVFNLYAFQGHQLLVRCSSGQHCLQAIIRCEKVVILVYSIPQK